MTENIVIPMPEGVELLSQEKFDELLEEMCCYYLALSILLSYEAMEAMIWETNIISSAILEDTEERDKLVDAVAAFANSIRIEFKGLDIAPLFP